MIEWLGIEHLFELSGTEAVWGFFTPLIVFAAFAVLQIILPARRVPGYVIDEATGQPRNYRLNGLLVFVIVLIVWATEITGMPREWFYRASVYSVAGGTVFTLIFAVLAVFTQPKGDSTKGPLAELWTGRVREISLFGDRFDIKMWFYVVGGAMLSLNALSGAAYHYDRFGADANPGVFLYAAFFTFYITDYFVFERVQLYTYDLIHERLGFMLFWGGLVWGIYGPRVAVHPAVVGHGRSPGPRVLGAVDVRRLAHRQSVGGCAVPARVEHQVARGEHAEVHVQAVPRPEVPRHHRAEVHRGRRAQDPVQRLLGRGRRHFNYMGEGFASLARSRW